MTIFNRFLSNGRVFRTRLGKNVPASYSRKMDEIHHILSKKREIEESPTSKFLRFMGACSMAVFGFGLIKGGIAFVVVTKDKSVDEVKELLLGLDPVLTKKQLEEIKEIAVKIHEDSTDFYEEWRRPWWRRLFSRPKTIQTGKTAGLVHDDGKDKPAEEPVDETAPPNHKPAEEPVDETAPPYLV